MSCAEIFGAVGAERAEMNVIIEPRQSEPGTPSQDSGSNLKARFEEPASIRK